MATLQDVLQVPPGWNVAAAQLMTDLNSVPADTQIEIENVDFWGISVLGDVVGGVPSIAQELQRAAEEHGSHVYGVALLHTTELNILGVEVDRYRWVVVHSQFQFVAILLLAIVLIGLGIVWICANRPSAQPCPTTVTDFPGATLHEMCNIFGAGCAVAELGKVILFGSLLSLGAAGLIFALELGAAEKLGLSKPRLPAVPAISAPQLPRVSTALGTPEVGPQVRLATGGRAGGRRGGGR